MRGESEVNRWVRGGGVNAMMHGDIMVVAVLVNECPRGE